MHLSPLGEDVGTVKISPRTSNEIILNQDCISSKRVGELNPLRTGRQLNGEYHHLTENSLGIVNIRLLPIVSANTQASLCNCV